MQINKKYYEVTVKVHGVDVPFVFEDTSTANYGTTVFMQIGGNIKGVFDNKGTPVNIFIPFHAVEYIIWSATDTPTDWEDDLCVEGEDASDDDQNS